MSNLVKPAPPTAPSAREEMLADLLRLLFTAVVAACWAGMLGGAYFAEMTRRRLNAPPPQFIENPLEQVEARRQAEADARELESQLEVQRMIFARGVARQEAALGLRDSRQTNEPKVGDPQTDKTAPAGAAPNPSPATETVTPSAQEP